MAGSVLVADRDPQTRELLREALTHDGFRVEVAVDPAELLAYANDFDVIIADIRFDVVSALAARHPTSEVVVVTCEQSIDDAVAAVREGAFDFVLRPFFMEDMSMTVASAAARRQRLGIGCAFSHVQLNRDLVR